MVKYHIRKDGTPGVCRATKNPCPLGGKNEHFESKEKALEFVEKRNLATTNLFDTDREQLLADRDRLQEEMNELKGLKKIKARKAIQRIEYALEGRDYDEEKKLEREAQAKRISDLKKKDEESLKNSKKLSELNDIEYPKSCESYKINGNWNRGNITAYRGEQVANSETNTGVAIYGQGRYTTTSKSYASKYGKVRSAEYDELPSKPLRLRTAENFQLLEQEVARQHNVNYRDLYKHMDVSDMIMRMGYNGLTIGSGKDMIIVRYYR